ncbi:MAG: acetyl-CoA carboxylase biotin carboxyl carrier protein subunit [Acidibrevibacterium sp.]|jgi:biotin carboxyl carrier protein|uniref:acetyl-CoA carboxylase biotin carboxyl carrier protein subunit n=1 Tax=Acidibrevibacterium fodinaquatile TaxID=1969806 RepID=UPI0023A8E4CA|nr:acetyl-CoA carboxylase biotin carboxyl carrier protein subunit [Acidibrevibacterium fodinaquatile]MCA7120324.1 acetyl-CoA carboxylase biotin carboxyl carrier protein subunit [Acidibrevibacterium fodinaquatile]
MAAIKLYSDLNAMVFRITVAEGDRVAAGETLLLLESMKMEIPLAAPAAGRVAAILVRESDVVGEGDALMLFVPD